MYITNFVADSFLGSSSGSSKMSLRTLLEDGKVFTIFFNSIKETLSESGDLVSGVLGTVSISEEQRELGTNSYG